MKQMRKDSDFRLKEQASKFKRKVEEEKSKASKRVENAAAYKRKMEHEMKERLVEKVRVAKETNRKTLELEREQDKKVAEERRKELDGMEKQIKKI